MSQVFVRNNGYGWFVRANTRGWPAHRAHYDLDRERAVPWKGSCFSTLVAFLAAEVRRLQPEVEVVPEPSGLDEFHPDTTHNPVLRPVCV